MDHRADLGHMLAQPCLTPRTNGGAENAKRENDGREIDGLVCSA